MDDVTPERPQIFSISKTAANSIDMTLILVVDFK